MMISQSNQITIWFLITILPSPKLNRSHKAILNPRFRLSQVKSQHQALPTFIQAAHASAHAPASWGRS